MRLVHVSAGPLLEFHRSANFLPHRNGTLCSDPKFWPIAPVMRSGASMRAEQYRKHAWECLAFAREMTSVATRALLLDMAHRWLALADQAEKNDRTELVYEPALPRTRRGATGGATKDG